MPALSDDKYINQKVAIFALDPGTTSGCAFGIFPAYTSSVWDGLSNGEYESWEVEGEPARQAWEIMSEYAERTGWPHTPQDPQWHLVFEDFVLRLGPGASSKRSLLDPVRITSACEALCWMRNGLRWAFPVYQQPSHAKTYATDKRLREHGMWVRGSNHRRDAMRHLIVRYANKAVIG